MHVLESVFSLIRLNLDLRGVIRYELRAVCIESNSFPNFDLRFA